MTDIEQAQKDIIKEFNNFPNWESKYKHLIDLGKNLPNLPEELKTEVAKVKGCQSQVWFHAHLDGDGKVQFQADSDGILVRGLIAILLKVFSGRIPQEILHSPVEFVKEIGFDSYLSPSRANGLMAMIKQIKYFALAFSQRV